MHPPPTHPFPPPLARPLCSRRRVAGAPVSLLSSRHAPPARPAARAALASNLVDLVLVPEVTIERLEDIFEYVDATLQRKGHMVIVVAEGAMQEYVATGKKDATGHTVYGDIGIFMRDTLNKRAARPRPSRPR